MSGLASDLADVRQKASVGHLESVTMEQPASPKREEASFSPNTTSPDARNWPQWKKNVVIFMVSFHSMSSTFMAAGMVPAASKFAALYGVSLADASYLVSVQVGHFFHVAPEFY